MKITVHRGANQIGGNCVELESGGIRILLDYGAPLPGVNTAPTKKKEDLNDYILNIPGLYEDSNPPISALLISHTHQDHYGMIFVKPINPKIPVYMSKIMSDIVDITVKMGPQKTTLAEHIKNLQPFKRGVPFPVSDKFTITPYLMDHSAAESFGFLIEAEGKRVFYTGDYRDHGHKKALFQKMLLKIGKVDVLITEGTTLGGDRDKELKSEKDVMSEIAELEKITRGAIYVLCAGQNVDLLTSLAGVADKSHRFLALDGYLALILERFKERGLEMGIEFKIPFMGKDYVKILDTYRTIKADKYAGYDETFSKIKAKKVDWDWVNANINKLIIPVSTYAERWVGENIHSFSDATLVYSMWEGYLEDWNFQKTIDFLESKGITTHKIHSSGHASFNCIKKLIESTQPSVIIPIHTEHPEVFQQEFGLKRAHLLDNGESLTI